MDTDLAPRHAVHSKYFVITRDLVIPLLITFASLAAIYAVWHGPFFQITSVQCELDYEPCQSPALLAELGKYQGQNLIFFDETNLKTRLTSGDFTIRAVTLRRTLPGTLEVSCISVYPVVALSVRGGDGSYLLFDQKLRPIKATTSDPHIPILYVDTPPVATLGAVLADSIVGAGLTYTRHVFDSLPDVHSVYQQNDTLRVSLKSGQTALLTTAKDLDAQLLALQAVRTGVTMPVGTKTIDVRFAQPVLKSLE
jgi:hypothetical protein